VKLYFSPLSCSLASRITIYETGAPIDLVEVDPKHKTTREEGVDYRTINPLGLVPALRMNDGELLTENAAILQHLAEQYPDAKVAPTDPLGRSHLRKWLSFIGTELHKALFVPLLDKNAPDAVKAYALAKAESRLTFLAQHLEGREFLLDRFSVADAYLIAVLNWTAVTPVKLEPWPALTAYARTVRARPTVARAIAEERELYLQELARHGELDAATTRLVRNATSAA
jgi:glutathione S-transferase